MMNLSTSMFPEIFDGIDKFHVPATEDNHC